MKNELLLKDQIKPVNTTKLYRISKKFFNSIETTEDIYKPETEISLTNYIIALSKIFLKS